MESSLKGFDAYDINTKDTQNRLGRGGFGDVYIGKHKLSGILYAIKIFRNRISDFNEKEMMYFNRSIEIHKSL